MFKYVKRLKTVLTVVTEPKALTNVNFNIGEAEVNKLKSLVKKLPKHGFEGIEYWEGDGDERWFGIQKIDASYFESLFHKILRDTKYSQLKEYDFFVLYGRLGESTLGSGGGWHRDAYPVNYKIIIYLTDVLSETSGPFEYVPKSASKLNKLLDMVTRLCRKDWTRGKPSWSKKRVVQFMGRSGSGIIVNTSAIHRGRPAHSRREAFTFYIYKKTPKPMQKYL